MATQGYGSCPICPLRRVNGKKTILGEWVTRRERAPRSRRAVQALPEAWADRRESLETELSGRSLSGLSNRFRYPFSLSPDLLFVVFALSLVRGRGSGHRRMECRRSQYVAMYPDPPAFRCIKRSGWVATLVLSGRCPCLAGRDQARRGRQGGSGIPGADVAVWHYEDPCPVIARIKEYGRVGRHEHAIFGT